jgi:molybdopterin-guanine dinucleotide biosynthesis protein B
MHELRDEEEPSLDALLARLAPCDLVVVEGFKVDDHPKLETRRRDARDHTPLPASANVVAIAADHPVEGAAVPVFALDAIAAIADFVETALGLD